MAIEEFFMAMFDYKAEESIGTVESVDTGTVVVQGENEGKLKTLQVNQLVALRSSKVGQFLIGLVVKIMRKSSSEPMMSPSPTSAGVPGESLSTRTPSEDVAALERPTPLWAMIWYSIKVSSP